MKIYDLSHKLNNQTPVYPGSESPRFDNVATLEKDGYRETHFSFESHLGTHIDAPFHMIKNGKPLDKMDVESFTGTAIIINVAEGEKFIKETLIRLFEKQIKKSDFILFRTGWSKYWGTSRYFEAFPTLNPEAVNWLLSFPLKGIGFDVISADPVTGTEYPNHMAILKAGLIIIENLNFPGSLVAESGEFSCFPLPYENADGSPVRAVFKA